LPPRTFQEGPRPETPQGALIAYCAKDSEVAEGGDDGANPFAPAFVMELKVPGREVRQLFAYVRDDVLEATRNRRQPLTYGSAAGAQRFPFRGELSATVVRPQGPDKRVVANVRRVAGKADEGPIKSAIVGKPREPRVDGAQARRPRVLSEVRSHKHISSHRCGMSDRLLVRS
jgi:hypothetical protein